MRKESQENFHDGRERKRTESEFEAKVADRVRYFAFSYGRIEGDCDKEARTELEEDLERLKNAFDLETNKTCVIDLIERINNSCGKSGCNAEFNERFFSKDKYYGTAFYTLSGKAAKYVKKVVFDNITVNTFDMKEWFELISETFRNNHNTSEQKMKELLKKVDISKECEEFSEKFKTASDCGDFICGNNTFKPQMEVDCNSKGSLISEPISYEFQLEEPTSIVILDKSPGQVQYLDEEVKEDGNKFPSLTIVSTYEVKCKAFVSFTTTFKLGEDQSDPYLLRSKPFIITIHVKKQLLQPAQDRQVSQNYILWKSSLLYLMLFFRAM